MRDHVQTTVHRFTKQNPCPVCGGWDNMPRGIGTRCSGFLSAEGAYIHCSRSEFAGPLSRTSGSGTFAHRASGPCRCGSEHAPAPAGSSIAARYDYQAADGSLLFQVLRYQDKRFVQRRPDGHGGWQYKLGDTPRVLYHLPELLARPAEPVYVAEGEKDADNVRALGLLATCNPMGAGAGKWRADYSATLAGRSVVILPDADAPGREHAAAIAEAITGTAASVRLLDLAPDRSDGYDVSDWLAAGHSRVELESLTRLASPRTAREPERQALQVMTAAELLAKDFPEPRWAVPGLLPEGLTLLVGAPKIGKSWLMLDLVGAVAAGGSALGYVECEGGRALYLALEDGERLLQRRVRKVIGDGADRLHIATSWRRFDDGGQDDLDRWLGQHPDTRLVVIDTLARIRPREQAGAGVYRQDYDALAPLADLAHKYNVAIVVVHHTRKMASDDVLDMVSGSNGLAGSVDAILVLQRQRLGDEGVLTLTGRDVEEQALAALFDRETCHWRLEGEASKVLLSKMQQQIADALAAEGVALRASDIADRLGRENDSSLRHVLCKMVREGALGRTLRGLYHLATTLQSKLFGGGDGTKADDGGDDALVIDVITCDRCDRGDQITNGVCDCDRRDPVSLPEREREREQREEGTDGPQHTAITSITSDHIDHIDHKRSQASNPLPPSRLPLLELAQQPCPSCGKRYHWKVAPYDVEHAIICKHCGRELRVEDGDESHGG